MFALVVGIVLALIFLGLPLAIIALFIVSNLDRSANWQALRDTITRLKVDYPCAEATAKRSKPCSAFTASRASAVIVPTVPTISQT
jgi:hypothetical protein